MLLFLCLKVTGQQDPIFSHYINNTQSINAAYAGIWSKTGFNSLVRKQWAGIESAPFTQMISIHTPLIYENMGAGLNIINDRYGFEERLSLFADYAYEVILTPKMQLRMGLKFGFMNYKNPLARYELGDEQFDPSFQDDIDIKFMPNFGVGFFLYGENFYAAISIPKLIKNDFQANRNNYSVMGEVRHLYLGAGYVLPLSDRLKFKPTTMFRATIGAPAQIDFGANFLLHEKLWLGIMLRTGDAVCFLAQWIFNNNMKIGYAMDITFTEIYKHQNGTYELTFSYDIDFFGRNYIRSKYF